MSPDATGKDKVDLGVSIVTFQSADVIAACLESCFRSEGARLRVVVVDNHSSDNTREVIREFAASNAASISFAEAELGEIAQARADLTLIKSPVNGGFAYGVNRGLEVLLGDPELELFWVLNPDCTIMPDTAAIYAREGRGGGFSLMGGRTLFIDRPDLVQTDGGRVSRWTGVVDSINHSVPLKTAAVPDETDLHFITGANCVAHRAFLETSGLMNEDYFIYYEEVDWAFQRGKLPLKFVPESLTLHHGGTVIGTGSHSRRASAFANYFNYRNRMRFMRQFYPASLVVAMAYAMAKAGQLLLIGAKDEAFAIVAAVLGMAPPQAVEDKVEPSAREMAFGDHAR